MKNITIDIDSFLDCLNAESKDELYRKLQLENVITDVENELAEMALDDHNMAAINDNGYVETVTAIARKYVYDCEYDCNLPYWTNIDNLIHCYLDSISYYSADNH